MHSSIFLGLFLGFLDPIVMDSNNYLYLAKKFTFVLHEWLDHTAINSFNDNIHIYM